MSNLDQMIATTEASLARLKTMAAASQAAALTAAPAVPTIPQAAPLTLSGSIAVQVLMALAAKALISDDQEFLRKHIAEGAPGVVPFFDSETIVALFQMSFTEYKEFLAGRAK